MNPVGTLAVLAISGSLGACDLETVTAAGDVTSTMIASSTSTEGWAMNYPKQRKLLFMAGALWIFYSDGNVIWARSSPDGVTLTDPIEIRDDAVFGHRMGCAFDGVYFHYAFSDAVPGGDVFYRRALPHSDGTLEWSTDEQVVYAVDDYLNAMYPKVIVDRDGHPWVSFMLFRGGYMTPPQDALVMRSDATDGSWLTSTGFPFTLLAGSMQTYPDSVGVALASGGTYWIVDPDGADYVRGRLWDSQWEAEEQAGATKSTYSQYDLVADGDDVHMVYGGGTLHYRRRDHLSGWGDDVTLTQYADGHGSLTLVDRNDIIATWPEYDHNRIVEREVRNGDAGDVLDVFDGGTDGLAGARLGIDLNVLNASAGPFRTAFTTATGTEPPYGVWLGTARTDRVVSRDALHDRAVSVRTPAVQVGRTAVRPDGITTSMSTQPGRNDPCPCGSGTKYKKCCLEKDEAVRTANVAANAAAVAAASANAPAPARNAPSAKSRVQPHGVSNRPPPPARRRSV